MNVRRILTRHKAAVGQALQTIQASVNLLQSTYVTRTAAAGQEGQLVSSQLADQPSELQLVPTTFNRAFKQAIYEKDTQAVDILWLGLLQIGHQPQRWMFEAKICMHARRQAFPEALRTFKELKSAGYRPTHVSYNAMLHSYSQAGQAAYGITPRTAADAKTIFDEMGRKGHERGMLAYNWLILCQSRAALPDKAYETYQQMLEDGVSPDHYTIATIMDGCTKAGQPRRAQEIFDTLFALHKIKPELSAWNSLLGAFARAGHKDGTYAVWQRMVKANVGSDEITQRLLAVAFGNNPQMANALVHEAKCIQDASQPEKLARGRPQQHSGQMHDVQRGIGAKGWAFLDLHGLSVPAAQLALQNRLQYLVTQPDLVEDAVDDKGLEIITGIGRHTREGRTFVLKAAVQQVLQQHRVKFLKGSNAGIVRVPLPSLQRFIQLESQQRLISEFLHGAGWRYLAVFGGLFSAVSAMYVVPQLLLQT